MITLDMSSVDSGTDEIYSVARGSKATVYLDDNELKNCIYCNVTKGVAICLKRDLEGNLVLSGRDIVHELLFGSFTVEPITN